MRIAIISDIHGNLVALDAVLDDVQKNGADQIICLGDVATLGPQPLEVIARIQSLNCPCIMGNHDIDVVDEEGTQRDMRHPQIIIDSIAWTAAKLTQNHIDFLQSFVPLLEIKLDSKNSLLCFHGSPQSNTDIILPETSLEVLDAMLQDHSATVMVGGHTHIQMSRQYRGRMIVNVGSVGGPMQAPVSGSPFILPWAEYAIVDFSNGTLSIELKRIPIDFDLLRKLTEQSDNPLRWTDFWITP